MSCRRALGFDLLWFGIVIVTVVEIGLITPPIGMNLFVIAGVAKDLDTHNVILGVFPFILCDFVGVALLVAFPILVT